MTGAARIAGDATARTPDHAPLAAALAADLELLADLHDREPTTAVVEALKGCPFAEQLSIRITSRDGRAALAAFDAALADIRAPVAPAAVDELAVGFADVYLRHVYRVSPTESFWLTEDGLERQEPMLRIRAELRALELRLVDPHGRPEDHLVPQLRLAALLLARAQDRSDLERVARFLDEHLLRWVHTFAARLVGVGAPDYYAALAVVTGAWLDEARELIARATGVARPPVVAPRPAPAPDTGGDVEGPYVPGLAPGW